MRRIATLSILISAWAAPALAIDSPLPDATGRPASRVVQSPAAAIAVARIGWPRDRHAAPDDGDAPSSPVYTVRRGDNLWSIASDRLSEVIATPTAAHIVRYWKAVISANKGRLRSGRPGLIYPGETINMPAPPAATQR